MGTVLTVMNMKGGIGKTTVAMHLGGMFSRYPKGGPKGRRGLLVDYDPQFNLSQAFLPTKFHFALAAKQKTSPAILQDEETDRSPFVLQVPVTHASGATEVVKNARKDIGNYATRETIKDQYDAPFARLEGHGLPRDCIGRSIRRAAQRT